MSIHGEHPFPTAPDAARRFRGRLVSGVTLWTSGAGAERAGLTVTSVLVVPGEPSRLLALLDPDAELTEAFLATRSAVCHVLDATDQALADTFGGQLPAPGGPFRTGGWEQEAAGPALRRTRAEVSLDEHRELGWSVEVVATIDRVVIEEDAAPLLHRRGRYVRLAP